jgi:bifunctional oligoribonuclease and PAP phosphatase NrnA
LKNTDFKIIAEIAETVESHSGPIVVVPHSNPDGDAIGSAYALAMVLRNAGKSVKIVTPNDYPAFLSWLNGEIEIINYLKKKKSAEKYLQSCAIMFCVDFNQSDRVDEMEKSLLAFCGTKILVDHHPFPKDFCDLIISEPSYSSSAELIYDLVQAAGWGKYLDKRAAEALYMGMMTDTGSFSYSTSRPGLYSVLAALMDFGIDTEAIHSKVYDNFSASRFQLLGYCLLHKMVVLPEYKTAYISITAEELKKFNYVPGDTEGFVNIPLSVQHIVFSALFVERENFIKASFRSKGSFPSNSFSSRHFNGGGHLNASGGESKLSLEKVIEEFTQLLPGYLHLLNNS